MIKLFFTTLSILVFSNFVSAQESLWRDHFSYRNCIHIAESENKIAAAAEMGLVIFDKLNQEISTISRVNGLNDVEITALNTITNDRFIVGYATGNIDIVAKSEIINIPDLKLKQIQGAKGINHFHIVDNLAYCSLDFAVMVIDLNKNEILETYYLGENSAALKVYESVVMNNHIYAATQNGVFKADLTDPNIVYSEGWNKITPNNTPYLAVGKSDNDIVTVKVQNGNYTAYYGDDSNWTEFHSGSNFRSLNINGAHLVISQNNKITDFNDSYTSQKTISEYDFNGSADNSIALQSALYSVYEEDYFIADQNNGLVVHNHNGSNSFIANGPYSNSSFSILATTQGVYSVAGGITTDYNNLGKRIEYSYFDNNSWGSYRSSKPGNGSNSRDLIRLCPSSTSDPKVYMSSWGGGIYETQGIDSLKHYGEIDGGLQDIYPDDGRMYVRVGGIASDKKGNIWMSNSEVNAGVVVKSGNNWHQFDYETTNDLHSTGQFLLATNNYLWIPIPMGFTGGKQGLMVVDTKGNLNQEEHEFKSAILPSGNDPRNKGQLRLWDENGAEITKSIFCLAEDQSGYIWLGTDKGVLVYYRPWAIFSEDKPSVSRIKVPRNDGSNLADYLLENERVTTIIVDGANRKWIGTEGSGLYLVSDDGLKTYNTFNTDNSPLPSNYITSVAIAPQSGEVFISTDKGIISYKGKATSGKSGFNKVYAYPNPVREDFDGDITITGLMTDSHVKITTVSGKLVYETRSLGGKAYWNGRNYNGEKVKTGVYLVYVSAEEGQQSAITKILVVR